MSESSELRSAGLGPRERLIGLVRHILDQPAGSRPLPIDGRLSDLGVSSIKMVSLMLAVEAEFGVTILQREITPENFDSISAVEAMILRLIRSERNL